MFHLDRTIDIEYASASASGRKAVNDDSLAVHVPTDEDQSTWKGIVAVLADGVSTADAGGQAAKMCVRRVVNDYYASPEIWSTQKTVSTIFTALNRRLYQLGTGYRQAEKGFVCTVSTLVLKSHHAYLFHVGDTRIYRLRAGVLQLLTTDHTAMENGNKAYLSRAIGFEDHVTVDCHETALENGDLFLLTTDGVHDHVSAARMQELANAPDKTLQTVCDQFLQEALAMNSPDNVSCIAIRIKKLPKISSGELSRHLKELPFAPLMSERASLDGYRIVREIYASARSQVYLVEDLESGKHYAMKTPSPNYNDNPHYIERFIMESWIGARIDSPHVVKVVSNCRPRSCLYYLTEYVDGGTLTEWMAQHPSASLQEVRPLIEQIVIGVRTFHRNEVLHQDIKPDNILVDSQGQVKIVDFGSCRVAGFEEVCGPIERDLILGTVDYTAPEYQLGLAAGNNSDLFSIGCIAYLLLTGQHPYGPGYSKCKTMADFSKLHYRPAYHVNPDIPLWVNGALETAVAIRREDRYEVSSQFIEDLRRPNHLFLMKERAPLFERDPVLFWKGCSAILAVMVVLLLMKLFG